MTSFQIHGITSRPSPKPSRPSARRSRSLNEGNRASCITTHFELKDTDGHLEWRWRPGEYSVTPDLGEITGAQASIYARAKVALDHVLPLLDGLAPLRPEPDPESVQAIRGIVRSQLDQLVDELGAVGGPRVERVDALFHHLIGPKSDPPHPLQLGGRLKDLRDTFGLERTMVNTVEDEQGLTNFLILVDYVASLRAAWSVQRPYFLWLQHPKYTTFTHTQLLGLSRSLGAFVALSQRLDALAQSVREAYEAMDSVFFGPAERQTARLPITGDPITVAELLEWVEDFATAEGPRLIQDSGKDGVAAFHGAVERLAQSVGRVLDEPVRATPETGQTRPPEQPGPPSPTKVRCAWECIRDCLESTRKTSERLHQP